LNGGRYMKLAYLIWLGAFQCLALLGQDVGAIGAPVLSFVYDSQARALRPVMGIPGAAELGTALDAGFSIRAATVSPWQDYALAVADDDQRVRVVRLGPAGADGVIVDGLNPAPDRILLSPSGSAAALYYATSGVLQVLRGLPAIPSSVRNLDLSILGGPLSSYAISDDGQLVLAGNENGLLIFQGDSAPRALPISGSVAAMAFRAGSDDVVVAALDGSISLIRGLSRQTTYRTLASETNGLPKAIAAEFSADGLRVYVISSDGSIGVFAESGVRNLFSCNCQASGLYAMARQTMFRLNDPSTTPLMLLDTVQTPERVWFVPAGPISLGAGRRRPVSHR